jgi:serine protease inhibitor
MLLSLLMAGVLLSGCTSPPGPAPPPPATKPVPTAVPTIHPPAISNQSIVDANNQFAFDLYSYLTSIPASAESNLFFSPFSISSALALTYEGARGSTAEEIRSVFHFPANDTFSRQGFSMINADLNRPDAGYTLRTANALWAEKTYSFLPEYLQIAREFYRANVTNLDFTNAPEASRITINQWVEDQTEDKIRDLIPPGVIDPLTRLVITNAIYFHGTWQKEFDKNLTHGADFNTTPAVTVHVEMMERTDADSFYPYSENDQFQILKLPYNHTGNAGLSMLILLPRDEILAAVERSLTLQNLSAWTGNLTSQRVNVYLPKFHLETKYDLSATLASMGMPTAFTPLADLSGMDGTHNLQISDVIHQAYVDVNEQGTEAAAATAVVIKLTSIEVVPEFRADHPFLFMITDDQSGTILFLGRVMNPNG